MIFVLYDPNYEAYKFMLNVNGVLNAIEKYEFVCVIDGDKNDLDVIKKLFKTPVGWIPADEHVKKFIKDKQIDITISTVINDERLLISLTNKSKLNQYLNREFYYNINVECNEYKIPSKVLANIINKLHKFRIKGSVYKLDKESKQILAELDQFKIS